MAIISDGRTKAWQLSYVAQCRGCDFEQQIIGRADYAYRMAEPPDVLLWAQFAWCVQYREVVRAEKLLTTVEIEEWLAGSSNKRICRDMELYRQMMLSRQSPTRCLQCGSTDILAASGRCAGRLIPHPNCGKNIVLLHAGFARLGSTAVYSPEGEHLNTVDAILILGRGY